MESYNEMVHRAALKITAKGKPVFPCKPDKAPYYEKNVLEHGCLDATTDPRKINMWWHRWPNANVGLPTGKASGILVIDLDTYKPGAMTVEEFEEKYGTISHTAMVRTGGGGLQAYLRYPDGLEICNSAGKLGPHVDVRGAGGYTLAPPSITTGRYEWINKAPLAPVPPRLLEALREEPRKPSGPGRSRSGAGIPDDGGPIPDGARDQTLTCIGGRLHDGTRDLSQLEDDLLAVNEARCIPPLPFGQVRKIARSVYRYEPCRPARRGPDRETAAALEKIERSLSHREFKGQGGKTKYSIAIAALKIARLYGERVEDGVRVTVSARQLALAAATSRSSIMRNLKDMDGILRPDNAGTQEGKAGAIVLLLPPAQLDTTLPTELVIEEEEGGCVKWRAPLTAPRLRGSSPAYKPRRGLVRGTTKVRNAPVAEKRAAVIRLGKSCEKVMDVLEAAGGSMTLSTLADAVDVKRPRDLTRHKNLATGTGRDGFVTRLENVGVVEVADGIVTLTEDWLDALDRERDRAGEIDLYRRDMARYNRERGGYRNRNKIKADPAPTQEEMKEARESYPARRRAAITTALARLFAERPEYRRRRAGQVSCKLPWYLPADFPRGPDGAPKDAEVEDILDGEAVA
jgi:bifunctional DNA primase/polymerase-like protein/primase-like protein